MCMDLFRQNRTFYNLFLLQRKSFEYDSLGNIEFQIASVLISITFQTFLGYAKININFFESFFFLCRRMNVASSHTKHIRVFFSELSMQRIINVSKEKTIFIHFVENVSLIVLFRSW